MGDYEIIGIHSVVITDLDGNVISEHKEGTISIETNKPSIREVLDSLRAEHGAKEIEIGKQYYVSTWTFNPLTDGYVVYQTVIKYIANVYGETYYFTGKDYRAYLPWDIHETREECVKINRLKNSYAYEWIKLENSLVPSIPDSDVLRQIAEACVNDYALSIMTY